MSPRVVLIYDFDFFFYSREENRLHVHVEKGVKTAKFWIEPTIELVYNYGFSGKELKFIIERIGEYEQEIREKWITYFCRSK